MVIFHSYVSLPGFFVLKTCEAFRAARETFGPVVAVWALKGGHPTFQGICRHMLYHCCRHCFKINGMVEGYIYIYIQDHPNFWPGISIPPDSRIFAT